MSEDLNYIGFKVEFELKLLGRDSSSSNTLNNDDNNDNDNNND